MGERVRNDITLGLPLQSIVTDRRSGRHRCFNIPRLNKLPFLLGTVCPDAGEAVRLQFYADLQAVGLRLVHPTLLLLHLRQNAELVLDVVTDLMRDHIRLGELAGFAANIATAEAPLKVLEEARVQIDLPVNRAIERTHCGLRKSAAGLGRPGKHYQSWRLVSLSGLSKNGCPLCFRAAEYRGNELAHGIGRRPGARCRAGA